MPVTFEELLAESKSRWQALTAGKRPWVRVGYAISGQAAGADAVFDAAIAACQQQGAEAEVSKVGSLGLNFLEPILDVTLPGGPRVFYGNVQPGEVAGIIRTHVKGGRPVADRPFAWDGAGAGVDGLPKLQETPGFKRQVRLAMRNCGDIDPLDLHQYVATGGYAGLHKAVASMTPEQVLEEVKKSGLRGRGGAAFPTGLKWSFLATSKAPLKYVLVNCEEGDPGAFNDKGILESDPHTVIEGLLLAGYATNSTHGIVFIRHGHELPISATRRAIEQCYANGLAGKNILGSKFSYDLEVALTGDSYVAGEETAMMEAIEGKRATPRYKPPFPAAYGVWGRPSNINNVKTIAYVPQIVLKGGDWFKGIGTQSSSGTAIVCLTGHIKRPGMYEVPMGTTIRQVLDEVGGGVAGGEQIKLLQTGGPLGGVLGPEGFDTPIDFDAMAKAGAILGSGGIIVGNETVEVVDLIRNLVAFCQFESCGKCFPCRLGNTHMVETLDRMCRGTGRSGDLDLMARIGSAMKVGSLCGHGQLGYNPISSALKFFGDEFTARVQPGQKPLGHFEDGSMIMPSRTRP